VDRLVFDDIPRRPFHAKQDVRGDRLVAIAEFNVDDLAAVDGVIDGLIAKTRIRALAGDIN
jgi:hypothetical protein